jgi:hypothetical protein
MRPSTRRIVPAEGIIKATGLNDALGEHAPWCRTAPATLLIHIKSLALRDDPAESDVGLGDLSQLLRTQLREQ